MAVAGADGYPIDHSHRSALAGVTEDLYVEPKGARQSAKEHVVRVEMVAGIEGMEQVITIPCYWADLACIGSAQVGECLTSWEILDGEETRCDVTQRSRDEEEPYVGAGLMEGRFEASVVDVVVVVENCFPHLALDPALDLDLALAAAAVAAVELPIDS